MRKLFTDQKKYILCLSLVFAVFFAHGQKHPYLFFTKDKVDQLKNRMKTDTLINNSWKHMLSEADDLLIKGDAKAKIDYLSLAYLVTGEEKYAGKVKEVLLKLCTQKTWSNEEMMKREPAWTSDLKTAENCWTVAIGYDAVYNTLSAAEKKTIVDGVVRMGIKTALNDWVLPDTRIHTLNSMGHNWWSACVGMAGIASLAIMDEHKEAGKWAETVSVAFEEWFKFNGDDLQFKPKTMDKDGGMYESFNYASFGTGEYLFFRLAFANTFPKKSQPVIKGLENMANWFMQASYPRNGEIYSLNFGDSESAVAADRSVKLLYALGYKNPNSLWYLNQTAYNIHKEGLAVSTPIGLLYEPDMKDAPSMPDLPTGAIYEDMDWAMLRNSWKKNETMLGVKSGYTWNHSHADANSFILFHKGEPIIKDAGNSWYASKDYPAYFFQSEAHNVMLFNGKAQPKEQQYNGSPLRGQVSQMMDGGDVKYVLANGVGPTAVNFTRNFRNFIWIGKVIIIIDDVRAHETGTFSWLLHPGGESKKIGGDISIVNNKSSVLVRPLFPETLVETGFDHDFPEKMKLEEIIAPKARDIQNPTELHYSVAYPTAVKQTKFITAIILKDSVNDKNIPKIERLHNETMNGVRITQNGKVTELYLNLLADGHIMHLNSINSFNGWETDAYLTGITYPENTKNVQPSQVTDYFMAYGSYLRKDGTTVFNSLSKLYMVASKKGDKLDMILQGQPLINASFYSEKKPSAFTLNHLSVQPSYQDKNLTIRIGK
jgi:hypothetical protein